MSFKQITSPSNELIKDIKALSMRKRRKETGLFVAEGLRTVIEAVELSANLTTLIYHQDQTDRADVKRVRDYCLNAGGIVAEVNDAVLEKLSSKDNPQRVIGVYQQKFSSADIVNDGVWVALDQVRDPGNLGTIIRTIDSVGGRGVLLLNNCCDPYSPESVQASMGSVFSVPIIPMTSDEFIKWKNDKWQGDIIGTILQTDINAQNTNYKSDTILLMGNEQAGLSDDLRGHCTKLVKLPMRGRADSLNLSIATGVMLYEIIR